MKALAITNHGGIYNWITIKQDCEKAGIKYIHGVEHYLCKEFEDNDRGAHICLYAKNWDGVKELNVLHSLSDSKGVKEDNSDRHKYHNPRISLKELMNTSDNIIVTTACLASPLNRWDKDDKYFNQLLEWMKNNKHRCFLEIQYHNCESQIDYNKILYRLSVQTGIPLISGTDTHSSSQYKAECRKILQKYKKSFYGEEDEFDLVWKSYSELIRAYEVQDALPSVVFLGAVENTNKLANMVENFELDKSFKYPNLYGNNVKKQWKDLIYSKLLEKIKDNRLDLPSKIIREHKNHISLNKPIDENPYTEEQYKKSLLTNDKARLQEYKNIIKEEFDIMCSMGMASFMLFMSELLDWCTDNNIPYGAGRGSVNGSAIAFITDITDVDPLLWGTVFSRFCNADRVSLGDIDVDFSPEDRTKVYEYITKRLGKDKSSYITTFGTLQDRGCIDVLAGGLGYKDLSKVMEIKNTFDQIFKDYSGIIQEEVNSEDLVEDGLLESSSVNIDNHDVYIGRISNPDKLKAINGIKESYKKLIADNQDLFYYLDGLKGTVVSKGIHPSGMIGSPITLRDNIGVYYKEKDGKSVVVSTCSMKGVDSLNYIKFDILGLKTVGIIKDACEYIGIPYPKSHSINWNDKNIWENMIQTNQAVFQFESSFAHGLLKQFKPTTINHMSMVNAALRPSGKSYRERLMVREFNKNPSEEIDNLLKDNFGFLIFQEDSIKFLQDICGFSGSEADSTRRSIGKKLKKELDAQLPKIVDGYCNHSNQPRNIAEEEAKQFVQIIQDSSDYQFGLNHSTAYSINGYICTMLRTYYPLELTAAYLNRAENTEDTNNGVELAKFNDIKVYPIEYGKSLSKYTIDKNNNAIYKGMESIKFCNSQIAEELMELSQNSIYTRFVDLVVDLKKKTSVNTRQLTILITLGFFRSFGENKLLLDIVDIYDKFYTNNEMRKVINKSKVGELGLTEYEAEKYSGRKTEKQYRELDIVGMTQCLIEKLENKPLPISEQIKFEMEYLEYAVYTNSKIHQDYYIITEFKTYKNATRPYIKIRCINNGEEIKTKVTNSKTFRENVFGLFSIIKVHDIVYKNKKRQISGEWTEIDELEPILSEYEVMKQ